MSLEWDPLPAETLPPGWCVSAAAPDRLVYRWHELDLTLEAARTEAAHTHPVLGVAYCWELQLCYSIGECPCEDRLARVSSRQELRDELKSCLEALHRRLSESSEPASALHDFRGREPD